MQAFLARFAFFNLLATGAISALLVQSATSAERRLSCAMAAAVNAVACVHYWEIWRIRVSGEPSVVKQENRVDALRFSDWATTLIWMIFDLHTIAEEATGAAPPWFSKEVAAALQPLMVLLGYLWRFWAKEVRPALSPRGTARYPPAPLVFGGSIAFFLSSVVFVLTTANLLLDVPFPSAAPAAQAWDAGWLYFLGLVWVGYPVVAVLQRLLLFDSTVDRYIPAAAAVKDVGYTALDLVSKGGLALFVALRAAR